MLCMGVIPTSLRYILDNLSNQVNREHICQSRHVPIWFMGVAALLLIVSLSLTLRPSRSRISGFSLLFLDHKT